MTARLVTLRGLLKGAIESRAADDDFVISGFEIGESYSPYTSLEEAPVNGKVWLLGMSSDQDLLTRPPKNACQEIIPITIGFQKLLNVDPTSENSVTTIDDLIEFVEQLKESCRNLGSSDFSWMGCEAMKDQAGVPYSFTGLRQANTFESYFIARYMVCVYSTLPLYI